MEKRQVWAKLTTVATAGFRSNRQAVEKSFRNLCNRCDTLYYRSCHLANYQSTLGDLGLEWQSLGAINNKVVVLKKTDNRGDGS